MIFPIAGHAKEEDHEGEEIEMRHDKQQQHKIHTINWIHTYIYV